jgi:hypothetical protein
MIALATIALGWLALMTLVVSSCRAARLGDQAQREIPSAPTPPLPPAVFQPVRRRRTSAIDVRGARQLHRPV